MRVREAYQYCADHLADAADGKSDRVIRRIVSAALSDLSAAHPWTRYQAAAQIPLSLGVNGTDVSIAQDGQVLTFGVASPVLPRYLAEKWDLTISGDSSLAFRLGAIDSGARALLAGEQRWISAAAVNAAHVWRRSVYPLPTGCKRLREIMLAVCRVTLDELLPSELDAYRWDVPADEGQPTNYAIREHEIELWPPLGPDSARDTLLVAYDRQPAVLTPQSDVDAQLDFDPRWDDLVEAAIDVVLATRHAQQSGFDLGACQQRLMRRLEKAKGEESRAPRPDTFGLSSSLDPGAIEELRFRRMPQAPDA